AGRPGLPGLSGLRRQRDHLDVRRGRGGSCAEGGPRRGDRREGSVPTRGQERAARRGRGPVLQEALVPLLENAIDTNAVLHTAFRSNHSQSVGPNSQPWWRLPLRCGMLLPGIPVPQDRGVNVMPGEEDFLSAIQANLDDDAPRLAHADWLQERDPDRAE